MIYLQTLRPIAYAAALAHQTQLFEAKIAAHQNGQDFPHYLLCCEHPPTYTLGKNGKSDNLLLSPEYLAQQGAALFHIDRGGDITYHGPGQLTGYPIWHLPSLGLGVRAYVTLLEDCLIDLLKNYGIEADRLAHAPGVWVAQSRKIAAIGIRCSRGVTMHGFALNINTDLRYFGYINPCGFTDKGVTSIAQELGHPVDFAACQEQLVALMAERVAQKMVIQVLPEHQVSIK
jgi:lipoyl(octanoyl) transferase